MIELIHDLPVMAQWVLVVGGAIAFLLGPARWAWRKLRKAVAKVDGAVDTLVGRPAMMHPDTGIELVPATPGLGARLAHMEEAIVALAETQREMAVVARRVETLTERFDQHITESSTHEAARVEEQRSMWQAIEAVAKSGPAA